MEETGRRELEVRYESAEAFRQDYEANLSSGGVFVPTEDDFAFRERVVVHLVIDFAPGGHVDFEGEVVHAVSPELAALGGVSGVAVQLRGPTAGIRERLVPLLASAGPGSEEPAEPDRRSAPRKPARVPASIEAEDAIVEGSTRDLSRSGALIDVKEGTVSIGETVRLALRHPTTGEAIEIDGRVARGVESGGRLVAVAVQFTPDPTEREFVERFLDDVQSVEHVRRLGGIRGTLAELDIQNLVLMFAGAASAGTLIVRNGAEEGAIGFEAGELRLARLGQASGMKALVRLLGWKEGSFEFHARFDEHEGSHAPLPLEDSLLKALDHVEEGRFYDARRFPPESQLTVSFEADADACLTKVEAAVLDVARAGLTVQHAIDTIPEPDVEIYRALESLLDQELLALR